MNVQDWRQCAQLYTENAVFCGLNGGGAGVHVTKLGQHEVRDWWRLAVVHMKLCNFKQAAPKIAVIGEDEIAASYDWFTLGSQADPESIAFAGAILSELWERRGGAWVVHRDIVEAGCVVKPRE